MYRDKLASFKKQLQQLKDGSHPDYNRKLKKLEANYKERYDLMDNHFIIVLLLKIIQKLNVTIC